MVILVRVRSHAICFSFLCSSSLSGDLSVIKMSSYYGNFLMTTTVSTGSWLGLARVLVRLWRGRFLCAAGRDVELCLLGFRLLGKRALFCDLLWLGDGLISEDLVVVARVAVVNLGGVQAGACLFEPCSGAILPFITLEPNPDGNGGQPPPLRH